MRFPTESDSTLDIINLGGYAAARVRADPEVKSLAPVIAGPQAALTKVIGGRNGAADSLTDKEAARDYRVDQLESVVLDLGRQAYAHYGSRTAEGYLRLFPKAPSTLAVVAGRERAAVFGPFVEAWKSPETPKAFAPTVKKLLEAWSATEAAEADVRQGAAALDRERKAEQGARKDWFAGYRRLHAQLTDRYPTEKKRVEAYFRSAAARGKAKLPPAPVAAGAVSAAAEPPRLPN